MNRVCWEFTYSGQDLLEASKKKRDIHQIKFNWWKNEQGKALEDAKANGIQIEESLAQNYSNSKASFAPQVTIK